jgi:hypothetical protein
MGGKSRDFEFQRLHGMGEGLYEKLVREEGYQTRIYAPVGGHRDLLAIWCGGCWRMAPIRASSTSLPTSG